MRMTIELTLDKIFRLAADHPEVKAKFPADAELTFMEGEMLRHHDLDRDNYAYGISVFDGAGDESIEASPRSAAERDHEPEPDAGA